MLVRLMDEAEVRDWGRCNPLEQRAAAAVPRQRRQFESE